MSKDVVIFTNQDMKEMAKYMGPLYQKKPEDLFALMLIAQAEGMHPATAASQFDIIQGRPAINSKSALARFQNAGGKIQWVERTDEKAAAEFSHPQGGTLVVEWTLERARKAQLVGKSNWQKFPAQMLSARVVAEGVRAVYPACLSGLYTNEEVADFDERPRTPHRTVKEAPKPPEPKNVTPAETIGATGGEAVETVKRIFEGKEVTDADTFEDDIPELKEGKVKGGLFNPEEVKQDLTVALQVFRQDAVMGAAQDLKANIIDWALQQSDAVKKSAVHFLQAAKGKDKVASIIAYINLYLMHPAILADQPLADSARQAMEADDAKDMLNILKDLYEATK